MANLPHPYKPCRIEVEVTSFGRIGVVVGRWFEIRDWVGVLEPTPHLADLQKKVMDLTGSFVDEDDLGIQLTDLTSGETWSGTVSHLMPPTPAHPWFTITWRDGRRPARGQTLAPGGGAVQKLGSLIRRILTAGRK